MFMTVTAKADFSDKIGRQGIGPVCPHREVLSYRKEKQVILYHHHKDSLFKIHKHCFLSLT